MKNLKVNDILIFISMFFTIGLKYCEMLFDIDFFYSLILIIGLLGIGICINFDKKYKKSQFALLLFFLFITGIITYFSGIPDFLIAVLLVFIFMGQGKDKLIRSYFYSSLFFFSLVLILNFLGILESTMYLRSYNGEILLRNSLGFSSVNAVFVHFFPIFVSGLYIFKNVKLFSIISLIISLLIYSQTYTRTGTISIILLILIYNTSLKKIIYKLKMNRLILYFLVVSVILAFLFSDINSFMNELVSDRFNYWYVYISNINIFNIFSMNEVLLPVDNLFISYLFNFSIFIGIIIYVLHIYCLSSKEIENRDKLLIFSLFLYALFESILLIQMNPVFILMIYMVFNKEKGGIYEKGSNC